MQVKELTKGFVRSNPIFVLLLGLCPTLATSSGVETAFAMGLAATFVLVCSNVVIALIRGVVPKGVRIPCYIVVIASFVTMADLFLQAFFPPISEAIGIFIPLIVVNCIILGRAEAYASKNTVGASLLDGVGMGVGFTGGLMLIAVIRELIGAGKLWGVPILAVAGPDVLGVAALLRLGLIAALAVGTVVLVRLERRTLVLTLPALVLVGGALLVAIVRDRAGSGGAAVASYNPMTVMVLAPGAFLVLGLMLGFFNWIAALRKAR